MVVEINQTKIQIFEGAKVKDVIRKFSLEVYQELLDGKKIIINQKNHRISLNGELVGSEKLSIISIKEVR